MALLRNSWTAHCAVLFLLLFLFPFLLLFPISTFLNVSHSNPNALQTRGAKISGRDPTLMQSQLLHVFQMTLEFCTHVNKIGDSFLLDKLGQ